MKHCTKCDITKSESEFYKKTSTPDGLYSNCKMCHRETRKKSYFNNLDSEIAYREMYRNRVNANPKMRALRNLKARIGKSLRSRGVQTCNLHAQLETLIGCTRDQYFEYLRESRNRLTWNSYAETWNVRTVLPPRVFNLKDSEQCKAAFNVANTSPTKFGT